MLSTVVCYEFLVSWGICTYIYVNLNPLFKSKIENSLKYVKWDFKRANSKLLKGKSKGKVYVYTLFKLYMYIIIHTCTKFAGGIWLALVVHVHLVTVLVWANSVISRQLAFFSQLCYVALIPAICCFAGDLAKFELLGPQWQKQVQLFFKDRLTL